MQIFLADRKVRLCHNELGMGRFHTSLQLCRWAAWGSGAFSVAPQAGRVQLPGLPADSPRTMPGPPGLSQAGAVCPHKGENSSICLEYKAQKAACEKFSHGVLGRRVCQAVWLLQVLILNFYASTTKRLLLRGTFSHSNLLFLQKAVLGMLS